VNASGLPAEAPTRPASDTPTGMLRLTNPVRRYPWGSTTHIPRFLGEPEAEEPSAELWMGAHTGDPSRLPGGDSLLDAIADAPRAMLGADVEARFGGRLPFLMKVLAAAEPLSLQVHPSAPAAVAGCAREDAAGVPRDAPHRCYRDDSHKPELIFALTRFEGMAGFREPAGTAALLRLLDDPYAAWLAERLESDPRALEDMATGMLRHPGAELPDLLTRLAAAAGRAREVLHREDALTRPRAHTADPLRREAARVFAMLPDLVRRYPADPGVLVLLLLNHVVLAPGESMYVGAGVVHAYTAGLGVEIMASSDNVLRAGLTTKHTDVDELLAITDFTPAPAACTRVADLEPGAATRLRPPAAEFGLVVAHAPEADLPAQGPRIVLALEGSVRLETADGDSTVLTRGEAVFVPHAAGALTASGAGRVAVGSVPPPPRPT